MKAPPVLYAKSGDLQIAYTVAGSGPVDFVWCPGFVSHLQLQWENENWGGVYRQVASFCRLIVFDKRGTGLSDRPPGFPTLEERIDDIRAVMDAAQSERAHIFGVSEGGTMACLFAATYPERTRSLLLYGTRPRWTRTSDYPWGLTIEEDERTTQQRIADGWRTDFTSEATLHWLGPGLRDDPQFKDWWTRFLQSAASPAARLALNRMNSTIDVRDILPSIRVPTVVIGKTGDPIMPPDCAKDLARRIPGARLVEIDAEGHPFGLASGEIVDTIKAWVTEAAAPVGADRFLATIMFVDIVRSTERVTTMGDAAWRALLDRYYALVRRQLALFGGVEVDTAGDGLLAHFDGPQRAIRCAVAIERVAKELGLEVRAGVHTGEVERAGSAIRGIAVHVAARVAGLGQAGDVIVTSTVRDLVAGSGLEFVDRGMHALKGVTGERQVLAVAG